MQSNAGSRRSYFAQRTTASETEKREQQRLDEAMELASKNVIIDVSEETGRARLQLEQIKSKAEMEKE